MKQCPENDAIYRATMSMLQKHDEEHKEELAEFIASLGMDYDEYMDEV
jgi:hypothetical protein